jgi:hypothetical protein
MRVLRVMTGKAKLSFVKPQRDPQDDVYYFPDGVCFTHEKKPSGYMIASVLAKNPDITFSVTHAKRAATYLQEGGSATVTRADRGVKPQSKAQITAGPTATASTAASSSSSTAIAAKTAAAKRPAASPTPKKKQKGPENLDKMD